MLNEKPLGRFFFISRGPRETPLIFYCRPSARLPQKFVNIFGYFPHETTQIERKLRLKEK
jgi:hypothetical protein